MTAVAIVIGRAGSRGLPGKNARMLAGRPMIGHTIEDAQSAGMIDRVVVSTDGDAIAAAGEAMSVTVVRRPPALAGPRPKGVVLELLHAYPTRLFISPSAR